MINRAQVDTVFFGPMVGELGWACSRWHAWCRYRRFLEFGNCRSIAMDYDWRYPLYSDFIDEFIPLPQWVANLGWEQDCYELVPPGSPPGGCTPVNVYTSLLEESKLYYDERATWTVRPPRGCNFIVQHGYRQMWKPLEPSNAAKAYVDSLLHNNKRQVIVVSGRKRARSADRNILENVWEEVVDQLAKDFLVVISGTRHSSALVDKIGRNIINLIPRTGVDGLDVLIAMLHRSLLSVTSQSGPTLISLLCETPSYIVGHESQRHSRYENFMNAACMFRTVPGSYSAMTSEMMIQDVYNFANSIQHQLFNIQNLYTGVHGEDVAKMISLFEDPEIEFSSIHLPSLQQEIRYADQR